MTTPKAPRKRRPSHPIPLTERVPKLLAALAELYPEPACALTFADPYQLAVATILSAQCTDKRVNLVTPALFKRYPTAADLAAAKLKELEGYIKSTGFYRNKAKNIRAFCQAVVKQHGGQVPNTLDELVKLPGIGRKTANVVLGSAFDIPGITVDTHVGRLARRLGLTVHTDPVKVEFDLMKLIPQAEWTTASHRIILHGRQVCHSRKPRCSECRLNDLCPKWGVPPAKQPGVADGTSDNGHKEARKDTKSKGPEQ